MRMWSFSRRRFVTDESGAVTVDWVVLTAAIVGISIGAVASIATGTNAVGTETRDALLSGTVQEIGDLSNLVN